MSGNATTVAAEIVEEKETLTNTVKEASTEKISENETAKASVKSDNQKSEAEKSSSKKNTKNTENNKKESTTRSSKDKKFTVSETAKTYANAYRTTADSKSTTKIAEKEQSVHADKTAAPSKTTTKTHVTTTSKATVPATASSVGGNVVCTVKIECSVILDNMDKLKAGHESFVPSDGVILDAYSVTVKSGSSAYDVLKTACDSNDIKLYAQKSVYGVYVVGINNIDEKDCGSKSGWLYSVNGKFSNNSCGSYDVKNGDTVVFSYTC